MTRLYVEFKIKGILCSTISEISDWDSSIY